MNIRRTRITQGFPQADLNPQGSAIPSQYQEQHEPYNPAVQPDIAQFNQRRHSLKGHRINLADRRKSENEINSSLKGTTLTILPQCHMAEFSNSIITANVAQIVLPSNLRRVRFVISNTTAHVIFLSWKQASNAKGVPIAVNGSFTESNNVSVDDIWILSQDAGAIIGAWEGTFADEANNVRSY